MFAQFLTHTQRRVWNTKYLQHAIAQTMFNPNIFKNGYNFSARPTHTQGHKNARM